MVDRNIAKTKLLKPLTAEEEDDDSSGGDSGFNTPIIDLGLFEFTNFDLMEEIREQEQKYSHLRVPITKDPNQKKEHHQGMGKAPPTHPLFADSQQFAGIYDPKNNPSPPENPEASEKLNELRLTNTPRPGATPAPTLTLRRDQR